MFPGVAVFIQPTPQEARKNVAPMVRVTTDTRGRAYKPETDDDLHGEAALIALGEAADHGYSSISYESVAEYMTAKNGHLTYQYVWMFSAWDGTEQ